MNWTISACRRFAPGMLALAAILLVAGAPLIARADPVSDGKAAFAACSACHTITGADRLGPHLNGVFGRKAGSVPGFNYSPAMKRSDVVWDAAALEKYIENPQKAMPGNRMPFAGMPDEAKRAAIAAYLAALP